MNRKRSMIFYIVIVAGLGAAIYWILEQGYRLQNPALATQPSQQIKQPIAGNSFDVFADSFHQNLSDPLAILLLQIIVIIAFARLVGFLFKKIGQSAVIGEIVAGIILGPSIVGLFFPQINQ